MIIKIAALGVAGMSLALWAGVPQDYEELDFVFFRKGVSVNTGLKVQNVQINMDFAADYENNMHLFGSASGGAAIHLTTYQQTWYYGTTAEAGGEKAGKGSSISGGRHKVVYGQVGTGDVIIDGNRVGGDASTNTTKTNPLLIGSRSNDANFLGKVYSFAITNHAGTALADYVPCRRTSDNLIGFYDRVSKSFKAPSGGVLDPPTGVAYEKLDSVHVPTGAYVDTGLVVSDVQITAKFAMESAVENAHIFGSGGSGRRIHFSVFQNKWYWGGSGTEYNSGTAHPWSAGVHTVVFSQNGTEFGNVVLDGTVLGNTGSLAVSTVNGTVSSTLYIGARCSATESNQNSGQRASDYAVFNGSFYYLEITGRGGECQHYYEPRRRISDGVIGLYDLITDQFLVPQGRPFERSADVGCVPIEYVELQAEAYVDTGLKPENVQITMDFEAPYESNMHIFGTTKGGARYIHFTSYQNVWCWGANGTETKSTASAISGTRHAVVYGQIGTGYVYVDGVKIGENTQSNKTNGENLLVGSRSGQHNFHGKVYSFAVTNSSNVALIDLVPARRVEDGAIGFWDKVGLKFVAVSGTMPTFSYQLPADYKSVSCVPFAGDGASLDLGLIVKNDQITMKFKADYVHNMPVLGQKDGGRYAHLTECVEKWYWGGDNLESNGGAAHPCTSGTHDVILNQFGTSNIVIDATIVGSVKNMNSKNGNLWIGYRNGSALKFVGDVYSLAVTNQSKWALLDLRPSVRKADGKYGFFDTVSGRFLTSDELGHEDPNAPDGKLPAAFTRLNYVQTVGAYVDSGLRTAANYRVETKASSDRTLFLKCLFGDVSASRFVGRVYETKIFSEERLVRDYIPAVRTTDNVVGFYERVSGRFVQATGGGAFEAGSPYGRGLMVIIR